MLRKGSKAKAGPSKRKVLSSADTGTLVKLLRDAVVDYVVCYITNQTYWDSAVRDYMRCYSYANSTL